ncbi:sulfotransferase family protein [Synechococcus sp. HB1133]|uniref:sulfotransferase family 2 domain-containing protein n=2 Tax=Synechococcus TaxID=1129 RepID=UPI001D58645E|nr:sulfotransferase family 2 domain-containing protein [Synechococcus sp. PH41509]MCB4393859.1 sulfotransferase family protein [Synechococcus sp. PH41509]MCB4421339.1 sulfotransferase family protein [Synechococcus sp. HB1133]MCB4431310.1 sulfotransferase family protein [Synechococcus sp. HBA1120]NHI80281.1 hypothetical protein [Synechococcus sp. HB1133]
MNARASNPSTENTMDKDKTIKELNKLNKILSQELKKRKANDLAINIGRRYAKEIYTLQKTNKESDNSSEKQQLVFLKLSGKEKDLSENIDHEFARKHTLVHLKSNSICTWIPKNGCSTLRYSIAVANGAISSVDDIDWIHKNNTSFSGSNKELLGAEYAFVVLRNPFKRLLSFYCDKLCNVGKNEYDTSYETAKKALCTDATTTFSDFVENLWENPNLMNKNKHIKQQCDYLIYKRYNDYLALEDFSKTASIIHEKTGLKLQDIRSVNSIYTSYNCTSTEELDYNTPAEIIGQAMNQQKKPMAEKMYSPELIKKVGTLYLSDIMLYQQTITNGGKEMEYWMNFML